MVFKAVRPIASDEQLTISYSPPGMDGDERRHFLRTHYFFG